jgi:hypothetical protein
VTECTGISAVWCPVHGACCCKSRDDLNDLQCPLHSPYSTHGETPTDTTPLDENGMKVLLLAEQVGLLLGCLRNYRRAGHEVDLQGALDLEPEVARLLAEVRAMLPRPE